jgi:hypothetical protein
MASVAGQASAAPPCKSDNTSLATEVRNDPLPDSQAGINDTQEQVKIPAVSHSWITPIKDRISACAGTSLAGGRCAVVLGQPCRVIRFAQSRSSPTATSSATVLVIRRCRRGRVTRPCSSRDTSDGRTLSPRRSADWLRRTAHASDAAATHVMKRTDNKSTLPVMRCNKGV